MRRVVIVAFPRVQTLDVHGPAEVFTTATQLSKQGGYAVEVVAARSTSAGPVTSSVWTPGKATMTTRRMPP